MSSMGGIFFRNKIVTNKPVADMAAAFAQIGLRENAIWPDKRQLADLNIPALLGNFWTDKNAGAKPFRRPQFDSSRGLAITANARIDDRTHLMHQLGMSARDERQLDDSELILAAYSKWAEDCPQYLLGDYAFAIWDDKKQQLFCARDHIGTKPFFFQNTAHRFTFACDIRAILAASESRCDLNESYVAASLLSGSYYSKERTFYQGVEKLPPGHSMTIDYDGSKRRKYWHPENISPIHCANDDDYAEALRELLGKAVSDRIQTDRKLGTHISGGLDSSAIASIAISQLKAAGREKPYGLCWQPSPPEGGEKLKPEHSWIKAMSDQEQLDVHHIVPDASGLYAMYQRDGTCEPCGKTLLNEDAIQQHAAGQGIGIILSGWGGDQLISNSGRGYCPELLLSGRWIKLYKELRAMNKGILRSFLTKAVFPATFPSLPYIYRNFRSGKHVVRRSKSSFLQAEIAARFKHQLPVKSVLRSVRKNQLDRLMDGLITWRLEEWAANALPHGIEYRYPMLDRRIMEFALAIPGNQFQRGKWNRWIFRNSMRDILPPEVCWNQSKLEVERVRAAYEPFAAMVERYRNELRSGQLTPERSKYLDMPRLIKYMEPESFRASKTYGPVQNALKFLDLG